MKLHFTLDPATDPRVLAFLQEHLDDMHRISPPESVHALNASQLRQPDIRFWTGWAQHEAGPALVASCALKQLDAGHVELKTMRVGAAYRGSAAAQQVLEHALAQARASGATRISLETGTEPSSHRPGASTSATGSCPASPSAATIRTPTAAS